ncbi:hypothetical protein MUK42_31089 [Musa troglodytarum]|uniref:Uncharacterized protein n=1 Tax=Musa troglodytarum TaxID=320322 RepID=A0A9E7FGH7_9LILI|nr:hypothetical protein MUK42_31089 [Musa troglodytarum]
MTPPAPHTADCGLIDRCDLSCSSRVSWGFFFRSSENTLLTITLTDLIVSVGRSSTRPDLCAGAGTNDSFQDPTTRSLHIRPEPHHVASTAPRWPRGHDVKPPFPRSRCKVVDVNKSDEDEGDFEFELPLTDPEHGDETIGADEIFSDGPIRPLCPVFGRGLPLADGPLDRDQIHRLLGKKPQRDSGLDSTPSSLEVDDLQRVVPGTPSEAAAQGRYKKSSSTGQSDGKKKGLFLAAKERRGHKKKAEKGTPPRSERRRSVKAGQWDIVTAHRVRRQDAARGSRSYRTSETWSGSSPMSMASAVRYGPWALQDSISITQAIHTAELIAWLASLSGLDIKRVEEERRVTMNRGQNRAHVPLRHRRVPPLHDAGRLGSEHREAALRPAIVLSGLDSRNTPTKSSAQNSLPRPDRSSSRVSAAPSTLMSGALVMVPTQRLGSPVARAVIGSPAAVAISWPAPISPGECPLS